MKKIPSDISLSAKTRRWLTVALVAVGASGFLLMSKANYGEARTLFAVCVGFACVGFTLYEVYSPLRRRKAPETPAEADVVAKQEGGGWFVAVVTLNLLWFLASTIVGNVGEAKQWWQNPVVDLNNGVQMGVLLIALSLLIRAGVPRVDQKLPLWSVIFAAVIASNVQALLDSHWHHLAISGHIPISPTQWTVWRWENAITIAIYCAGAIAVLHRVPLKWACIVGFFTAIAAGVVLYLIYGVF